jgi:hypothetical protein
MIYRLTTYAPIYAPITMPRLINGTEATTGKYMLLNTLVTTELIWGMAASTPHETAATAVAMAKFVHVELISISKTLPGNKKD